MFGEPSRRDVPVSHWVAQTTLSFDIFSTPLLDLVSRTLIIEIKFYILCCVFANTIKAYAYKAFLCVPLFALALAYLLKIGAIQSLTQWIGAPGAAWPIHQITSQLGYVCFLFCGYFFWIRLNGRLSVRALTTGVVLFFIVELVIFLILEVKPSILLRLALSQSLALLIFAMAFRCRAVMNNHRVFDGLASVSYPLYVSHLTVGWAVLTVLHRSGVGGMFALGLALLAALLVAYLIHIWIEQPSLSYLARRSSARSS
jgi:hypothetical protein